MRTGLIVEDLPNSVEWLARAARIAFPTIQLSFAESLAAAEQKIAAVTPELALIDLGLPDGNGTDLVARMSAKTLCVVTTVLSDDKHLFAALKAGAAGYLLKDQEPERIAELLRGISDGQPPLSPAIARRLLQHFQLPAALSSNNGATEELSLSPREHEVLLLIAKGYPTTRVGEMLGISYNTAAGYVKSIYRKLNVSSRAEVAVEANKRGLVR